MIKIFGQCIGRRKILVTTKNFTGKIYIYMACQPFLDKTNVVQEFLSFQDIQSSAF